jgi:hypothetical protein
MTDKERILTYLFRKFYAQENKSKNWHDIKVGDLVVAQTSGVHDWTVGYVVKVIRAGGIIHSGAAIREIGGNRVCNITNEEFYKVETNGEPMLLEGQEYKTYRKVVKAVNKLDYFTAFHSIKFDNRLCTVFLRERLTEGISNQFQFNHSSKTTIKEIVEVANKKGIK